jgi:iron complex outermembrane receptor protein
LAASGGGIGSSDYYHDTSRAVYGQITYDLSGISSALDGFKIDLGARYTADTQSVCDVAASPEGLPIVNENECLATVGAPPALLNGVTPINAASVARAKSDKLTWNAGLDYQVNDDVLLYAVERRGYRAGGLNTPEFANLLIPFQSFKPETVTDTEVGAKTEWSVWDRPGLFNIAAYSSHYDNFQIGITSGSNFNPDGDPAATAVLHIPSNTTFYANVGTATVQGVEAQVNFSPVDGLTLGGSASWIGRKIDSITLAPTALAFFGTVANAKVESAAHGFANSPPFAYNATLDYIIPFDPAVGEVVFHAKYAKTGPISLISFNAPSWDEVDLRIDWNGIYGSNLDAGFFVTNVGNTVAIVAPSFSDFGFGYAASIYNQPRMFGVELRYHLGGEE